MKRTSTLMVSIMLSAVVVLSGCTLVEGTYKYTQTTTETETFDLAGIETVEMRLGSADIEVISKDVGEADFVIKKTAKAREEDYKEELLKRAVIELRREGTTLVIEREQKKKTNFEFVTKGYVSIDITATLPAGLTLDILTGSGDLDIDDRTAPVKIRTGSGDVTLGDVDGTVGIRSGSGDVRVGSVTAHLSFSAGSGDLIAGTVGGDLEASVGSGDIRVDRAGGELEASSGSGDIVVDASAGEATAESGSGDIVFGDHRGDADIMTSSGDVDFHATAGRGEVRIKTASGDVDVVVYDGDSVELDINTSGGSISTKIPIVVKEASRRRLHGISGSGEWKLRVSTASGDVLVRSGSI